MADGSRAASSAPAIAGRSLVLQIFADSADAGLAADIAEALHAEGHCVRGGAFDPEDVDAVVVVWSAAAAASPAMLAAAAAAGAARPLVPVSIGGVAPCGVALPEPMPLDAWRGDRADARWRFIVDELRLAALRGAAERAGLRAEGGAPPLEPLVDDADFEEATTNATLTAPRRAPAAPHPPRPMRWNSRATTLAGGAAAVFGALVLLASLPETPSQKPARESVVPPSLAYATPSVTTRPLVSPPAPAFPSPTAPLDFTPATDNPPVNAPQTPRRKPAAPVAEKAATDKAAAKSAAGTAVDPLAALIVKATGTARRGAAAFRDCASCPPMLRITPGRLAGGATKQVAVARAFAIGAREVTFAEWDACVVDGGCRAYRPSDAGFGRGGRPVINVSYEDAVAFADWLSARTGARYRLPTEEEWTFVAASGGARPMGETKGARPVDAAPKDTRGATGLLGNVWEWTADCTRWTAGGACAKRVVKGGAWNTGAWRRTPGHIHAEPAAARDYDLGFRLARDL